MIMTVFCARHRLVHKIYIFTHRARARCIREFIRLAS